MNHRRYLMLKYRRAVELDDELESVWDVKRRTEPGTPFPDEFPARRELVLAGYLVTEEIAGATADELILAGLNPSQAAAALAAIG